MPRLCFPEPLTPGIVTTTAPMIHGRSELVPFMMCGFSLVYFDILRINWREVAVAGRVRRDLMAGAAEVKRNAILKILGVNWCN